MQCSLWCLSLLVLLEQAWGAGWFCPHGRGKKRTPSSWVRSVVLCHTKLGLILGLSQLHPSQLLEGTSQSMAVLWSCQLCHQTCSLPWTPVSIKTVWHFLSLSSPGHQIPLSYLRGPLLAQMCPAKVHLLNQLLQMGMPEIPHLLCLCGQTL